MGGQPAQQGAGVPGVVQVTGAVERVVAPRGKAGRVADVVQPPGGFQEIGVRAEYRGQAACPAATPWTCAQRRGRGC